MRLLAPTYVAAVALVSVAHLLVGRPMASDVALTPERLAAGKVWLLATSAFLVKGPLVPELAGLALAVAVLQTLLDAGTFALVAPSSHVGGTLLAYVLLLATTGDPDGSPHRRLDYGISAVWLGLLGALFVCSLPAARRRSRWGGTVLALTGLGGAIGVFAFAPLAAAEHGLAFAIGALGGLVRPPDGE